MLLISFEQRATQFQPLKMPQGSILSPLLSNIYLHYVLDLWFSRKFRRQCRGEAYCFRFADDFLACFQYRENG